jgi:hypothetical protein
VLLLQQLLLQVQQHLQHLQQQVLLKQHQQFKQLSLMLKVI